MTAEVYMCPTHGEVWRYLGPEGDCAHCLRDADLERFKEALNVVLDRPTEYHIPPAGYRSIAEDGCKQCGEPIIFSNVVGGQRWVHLTTADHDVVIPRPWWDTRTGTYRTDNDFGSPSASGVSA